MTERHDIQKHRVPAFLVGTALAFAACGCYNFAARQREIDANERKVQETTDQIHQEMERTRTLEQSPK